jgi:signal transduction histidine kinase/CheY-like chemotaxis protein
VLAATFVSKATCIKHTRRMVIIKAALESMTNGKNMIQQMRKHYHRYDRDYIFFSNIILIVISFAPVIFDLKLIREYSPLQHALSSSPMTFVFGLTIAACFSMIVDLLLDFLSKTSHERFFVSDRLLILLFVSIVPVLYFIIEPSTELESSLFMCLFTAQRVAIAAPLCRSFKLSPSRIFPRRFGLVVFVLFGAIQIFIQYWSLCHDQSSYHILFIVSWIVIAATFAYFFWHYIRYVICMWNSSSSSFSEDEYIPLTFSTLVMTLEIGLVMINIAGAQQYTNFHVNMVAYQNAILVVTTVVATVLPGRIARSELADRERMIELKQKFVRYISHEIRTPINISLVGLEVLEKNLIVAQLQDDSMDVVKQIKDAITSATDVLNDLLTYEKINSNLMTLERSLEVPMDILIPTVTLFRIDAQSKDINLSIECADELDYWFLNHSRIDIDKFKLIQVIRNFLSNALKFTPRGGDVIVRLSTFKKCISDDEYSKMLNDERSISHLSYKLGLTSGNGASGSIHRTKVFVEDSGNDNNNNGHINNNGSNSLEGGNLWLRICIVDNGAGIAPQNIYKVFNQIIQFDANKLQAGKGSGLGLYISKGIADLHGGKVYVRSKGLGKGCAFYLELPLIEHNSNNSIPDINGNPSNVHHARGVPQSVDHDSNRSSIKSKPDSNIITTNNCHHSSSNVDFQPYYILDVNNNGKVSQPNQHLFMPYLHQARSSSNVGSYTKDMDGYHRAGGHHIGGSSIGSGMSSSVALDASANGEEVPDGEFIGETSEGRDNVHYLPLKQFDNNNRPSARTMLSSGRSDATEFGPLTLRDVNIEKWSTRTESLSQRGAKLSPGKMSPGQHIQDLSTMSMQTTLFRRISVSPVSASDSLPYEAHHLTELKDVGSRASNSCLQQQQDLSGSNCSRSSGATVNLQLPGGLSSAFNGSHGTGPVPLQSVGSGSERNPQKLIRLSSCHHLAQPLQALAHQSSYHNSAFSSQPSNTLTDNSQGNFHAVQTVSRTPSIASAAGSLMSRQTSNASVSNGNGNTIPSGLFSGQFGGATPHNFPVLNLNGLVSRQVSGVNAGSNSMHGGGTPTGQLSSYDSANIHLNSEALKILNQQSGDEYNNYQSHPVHIVTAAHSGNYSTALQLQSEEAILSGKTLLVVDDSAINLKMVVLLFKKLGANVYQAHDGKEALEIIKQSLIDNPSVSSFVSAVAGGGVGGNSPGSGAGANAASSGHAHRGILSATFRASFTHGHMHGFHLPTSSGTPAQPRGELTSSCNNSGHYSSHEVTQRTQTQSPALQQAPSQQIPVLSTAAAIALSALPSSAPGTPHTPPASQNIQEAIDLVIMDNLMPEMNGPDAARAMREAGFTGPIFGLTGHALREDIQHYIKCGADTVFKKPIDMKRFCRIFRNYTDGISIGHEVDSQYVD